MRNARPGETVQIIRRHRVAVVVVEQPRVNFSEHIGGDRLAPLDPLVRPALEIGKQHLRVKRAHDLIDGMLEQQEPRLGITRRAKKPVEHQTLVDRGRHLRHEKRVAVRGERLRLIRKLRVHRVPISWANVNNASSVSL